MKTVRLTTCMDAVQAYILQGALKNQGIDSILKDEYITGLFPNMVNIMNAGVQVLVFEEDYERAMEILKINLPGEVEVCPYCGSDRFHTELGKKRWTKVFFVLFSVLWWTPLGNIRSVYVCDHCGEEFRVPAGRSAAGDNEDN